MKTFLQLTNKVIQEAGIFLDPLTSTNFSAPPDIMYTRVKDYVNQAHNEIILERGEWEFQNRNAVLLVSPRMYVEFGDRATAPPAGSTFETDETEFTFEVVSTTLLSGAWATGTAKAYVDFIDPDGHFKFNESVNEVLPTPANDKFTIMGWGRYDLASSFSDLDEANTSSFQIQSTGGSTVQDNEAAADLGPLVYIPHGIWNDSYETAAGDFGTPRFITTSPNGHYELWPRPDKQYVLKFNYSAKPVEMSAHGSTHTLPELLEDAIIWRAVMYYGQYDNEPGVAAKGRRRYMFYKRILDKNKKPKFAFGLSKFL